MSAFEVVTAILTYTSTLSLECQPVIAQCLSMAEFPANKSLGALSACAATAATHATLSSVEYHILSFSCRHPLVESLARWLSIRLETLGALSAFAAAALAVEQGGAASVVGLSLSYALQITQLTNMTVGLGERSTADQICELRHALGVIGLSLSHTLQITQPANMTVCCPESSTAATILLHWQLHPKGSREEAHLFSDAGLFVRPPTNKPGHFS